MKVKNYQLGIFKISHETSVDTDVDGQFIEKDNNNYYDRGEWEEDSDVPSARGGLMLTNPIPDIFTSATWGEYQGKATITVPAGTFEAWKFFRNDDNEGDKTTELFLWFVPYIGYVKVSETDKEEEKIIWNAESELTSYSF